jgi:hypothetical protein
MMNNERIPREVGSSEGLGPDAEDDGCSAPPRVTDPPADLWLVYGELEHDDTHWNCCRDGEVSWCEDKQYDSDVHYVRGDRYDDTQTDLDELRKVVRRMVAGIDHLDKLTREWEPDHSSGADRRGWLLAKDARDDAVRLLGPNVGIEPHLPATED